MVIFNSKLLVITCHYQMVVFAKSAARNGSGDPAGDSDRFIGGSYEIMLVEGRSFRDYISKKDEKSTIKYRRSKNCKQSSEHMAKTCKVPAFQVPKKSKENLWMWEASP